MYRLELYIANVNAGYQITVSGQIYFKYQNDAPKIFLHNTYRINNLPLESIENLERVIFDLLILRKLIWIKSMINVLFYY